MESASESRVEKRSFDAMQEGSATAPAENDNAKRAHIELGEAAAKLKKAQADAVRASFIRLFTGQFLPLPMAFSHGLTLHGTLGWSMWLENASGVIDYTPVIDVLGLHTPERCEALVQILRVDNVDLARTFLSGLGWPCLDSYMRAMSNSGEKQRDMLRVVVLLAWTLMFAKHSAAYHYGSYELQVFIQTLTMHELMIEAGTVLSDFFVRIAAWTPSTTWNRCASTRRC